MKTFVLILLVLFILPTFSVFTQEKVDAIQGQKSKTTAMVYSILLPSAGHAYAGNWTRGLPFAAARVAGIVVALTLGSEEVYTYDPEFYTVSYGYYSSETTVWLYVGIGVAAAATVWEVIDASGEVGRYNEKLLNKINEKNSLGFDIVPSKNGPQFQLSYRF
jgi:hypothetical protein